MPGLHLMLSLIHICQRQTVVQCFGKPGYFMPRCICQCQQEAGSHIPEQQQAGVVFICLLPVLHIGAGFVHQWVLAVVVGKGVVIELSLIHILGKLVGADTKLLCQNLPVALCL